MNTIHSSPPSLAHRPQTVRPGASEQRSQESTADPVKKQANVGAQGEAKGVVRLLEEGHFKGVADVRLRINFHEQLSASAEAKSIGTARQAAEGLGQAVNHVLEQQPEVPEGVSEVVNGFQETLAQLRDSTSSASEMSAAVSTSFNDLTTSLRDVLGLNDPPTEEPPAGAAEEGSAAEEATGSAAQEASEPTGFNAENFLAALAAEFDSYQTVLSESKPTDPVFEAAQRQRRGL